MTAGSNDECRMTNGRNTAPDAPFVICHSPLGTRRLIVNADDFGLSPSVNSAVIRAHREGILTSASLMVNESGFDEAVKLAKENPRLGVGLHLTLLAQKFPPPPKIQDGQRNQRKDEKGRPHNTSGFNRQRTQINTDRRELHLQTTIR